MICGWVWVLKTSLCIREASPNLWKPSHTNTSFSLELRSPAPTRSPWTRGRCSLKRPRSEFHVVNVPKKNKMIQNRNNVPSILSLKRMMVQTLIVCFVCLFPGWWDHKDHESLHKHDREEALQCEVCLQFWEQLDQMIDMAGHQIITERKQTWREGAEKRLESRKHRDSVLIDKLHTCYHTCCHSYTGHFVYPTWNVINCLNVQETTDGICFLSLHQPQPPIKN